MAEAISCPHCDRQIALRAELAGRRVVCPHCRSAFVAPAAAGAPAAGPPALPAAVSGPAAPDFLAGLPGPTPRSGPSRPTNGGGRQNAKKPPVGLYVMGGVGATVLLFGVIAVVAMLPGGQEQSVGQPGGTARQGAILFGLTDPQRERLFQELVRSVYDLGMTDACRQRWQEIEKRYGVDKDATEKILDEGFDRKDWRNPDFTTIESHANFKAWNAERWKGRDPLLSD